MQESVLPWNQRRPRFLEKQEDLLAISEFEITENSIFQLWAFKLDYGPFKTTCPSPVCIIMYGVDCRPCLSHPISTKLGSAGEIFVSNF